VVMFKESDPLILDPLIFLALAASAASAGVAGLGVLLFTESEYLLD
jgi:hypothetical protein